MSLIDRPAPRAGDRALAIGVFVALLAAVLPLLRVVEPGAWVFGVLVFSAAILGAGYVARRYRLPAVAVSLIEAAVWVVLLSVVFFRETALLAIIPTPDTIFTIPEMLQRAGEEIALGVAPLTAGRSLEFLIVGAVGLLAIVLDHVVITARLPLVAAVGLIAVSLIPSIAVPGDIDIFAFALLAGSILFLVRVETRTRAQRLPAAAAASLEPVRSTSVAATAFGIGAIAVVVALVVTPLLPPPETRAAGLGVSGVAINPTLRLGDDLRRPTEAEVLTVRTTAPGAPYLRAVTLSSFNGRVWEPDRREVLPLGVDAALGPVNADPDIKILEYTTDIEVRTLQTQWLPIPFPAVDVSGLNNQWSAMPYNRTVTGSTTTATGLAYEVDTQVPRPTLEQIRSRAASGVAVNGGFDRTASTVPPGLPDEVAVLAEEVTAQEPTDYDKLVALQAWFRGTEFNYSLEAPVEQDFDGSGLGAVATFLEVKAGYCVHFASAFALMARTLGMSSRIVVGYLPGNVPAGIPTEVQTTYTVSSSLLHAWPEVYFEGIGWVPFDPTKTLGTPTAFSPAASGTADRLDGDDPLDPVTGPTAAPSLGPQLPEEELLGEAGGLTQTQVNPLPWTLSVAGVLLLLLVPALLRELRRRQQLSAAREGEVASAWTSVQDVAIDLGISVPASESPRAFGARLMAAHGAPPEQMSVLIRGIERASYAPGRLGPWEGQEMADAASVVRLALLGAVTTGPRLLALLVPRSLVIRPGSMYAGAVIAPAAGRPAARR